MNLNAVYLLETNIFEINIHEKKNVNNQYLLLSLYFLYS